MSAIFPDFLRAIVSTTMNVFLMMSLLQPKYSKKVTRLAMLCILTADLGTAVYCYISGNLTMLAKIDVVLFAVLCFAAKPLFKDTFMQWLFSYITVQNCSDIIIILSFQIARFLPYPEYGNTVIRLILFSVVFLLLYHHVRPLYRQMVEHWAVYFYVALAIAATLSFYVFTSEDIIVTLTEQAVPLLLITTIAIAAYFSLFRSLADHLTESALAEENLKMQSDRELLRLSATSMADRLRLMDEAIHQQSIATHDRRHFNSTILGLLEQGLPRDAAALLQKQTETIAQKGTRYCENTAVNAAVAYYVTLAESKGIVTDISLEIPSGLAVDSLELSMAISNLLENAIHGCEALPENAEKEIRFVCRHVGRLVLELSNPCTASTTLDESGYPTSSQKGHGIGTKSVLAFAAKYDGELFYRIENGIFTVRLLV